MTLEEQLKETEQKMFEVQGRIRAADAQLGRMRKGTGGRAELIAAKETALGNYRELKEMVKTLRRRIYTSGEQPATPATPQDSPAPPETLKPMLKAVYEVLGELLASGLEEDQAETLTDFMDWWEHHTHDDPEDQPEDVTSVAGEPDEEW